MEKETRGTVLSVSRQRWLKINKNPVRTGPLDGAAFPHIIKISYSADGSEYIKRKWLGAGRPLPTKGSSVKVIYDESRPSKAKIALDFPQRI